MGKKILILVVIIMITYGCARPLTSHENIPPPPSQGAIWVYGHYDSQGRWVPGRWIE